MAPLVWQDLSNTFNLSHLNYQIGSWKQLVQTVSSYSLIKHLFFVTQFVQRSK